MLKRLLISFLAALLLNGCYYVDPPVENQDTSGSISHRTVRSSLPENIDPNEKYVFYLHGKIIEDEGADAVSPQYGPYEFDEILSYLADAGFIVISEVRASQTDVDAYADLVVSQVESLLAEGVPGDNITIVGFSKGGAIAIVTSSKLSNPDLNFVLLGICGDWINENALALSGKILSFYERSDELGSTCSPLINRSPEVIEFTEIELTTGKQHGAFYSADPLWLDPLISWIFEENS